jgi:predicted RNA-binding protein YlxR (DUF448 family)
MCIGCRERDLRSVLLRVVLDDTGSSLVVDQGRRSPGRGAWLHLEPRCLDLAERRQAFPRALRHLGSLDLAAVRRYLEERGNVSGARGGADS